VIELPFPEYSISKHNLFDSLSKHANADLQTSSKEIYHRVQKHCILNNFEEFFDQIKLQLENNDLDSIPETKRSLRFLTHLILLLRNLDLDIFNSTNYIILKYIHVLQSENMGELTAMYFKYLPTETQLSGYSSFLQCKSYLI
jgi:hypothetical protein